MASLYTDPLLHRYSMVLNAFVELAEVDHDREYLLFALTQDIPALRLECCILILWYAVEHAEKSIEGDCAPVWVNCGY